MITTLEKKRPWQKAKQVAKPAKTSRLPKSREAAFDVIREVEKERPKGLKLQRAAAELKTQVDACKESLDAAAAAWRSAERQRSTAAIVLDHRERRALVVLDRTAPEIIGSFIDDVRAELQQLRNGETKVLTGKFPDGYTADLREHRGGWSTYASQNRRVAALLHCISEADSLKRLDMKAEEIERRLATLYDTVLPIEWEKSE